jgi:hypothetical protein
VSLSQVSGCLSCQHGISFEVLLPHLWGANSPSQRLTCGVLSQPPFHAAPALTTPGASEASPKEVQEDYRRYMNGQYEDHAGGAGPTYRRLRTVSSA